MKSSRYLIIGIILLSVLVMAGCVGKGMPVHQYTLETITDLKQSRRYATDTSSMILVGPINLPRQYDGRSIVTRSDPAVITSSATHLWAAPLDDQIASTMARDLALLLKNDNISAFPGPRFGEKKWQVVLDVQQFSGSLGKEFTCSLFWTINDLEAGKIIQRRKFSLTVPIKKDGFRDYVIAASTALADLSRELAPVLATIENKNL